MTGSIATPTRATPPRQPSGGRGRGPVTRTLAGLDPAWVGAALLFLAVGVYVLSNPERRDFYDHFVWQADAFLHGRAAITWPVSGEFGNDHFQDVYPLADQPGFALIPFPPLPAVVLLPVVAVFGLAAPAALVAAVLGAVNVGLCWRMVVRVTDDRAAAVLATTFYGFGTVAWYAAMLGSTWFLAHVVASTFLFLAITAALDGERREATARGIRRIAGWIEPRQFVAGLLFGTAALARLTPIFGAPFFVFVGGGGGLARRAVSAGLGAAIPVALLLAYNVATTGYLFHPAYEDLYGREHRPVPQGVLVELFPALEGITYHPDPPDAWAIEDPRYAPQNLLIALAWLPEAPLLTDEACRSAAADPGAPAMAGPEREGQPGLPLLLDRDCPLLRPDPLGMSLLLTSPAYLLAIPVVLRDRRRRLVAGSALAVGAIAIVNLMHFSQGWVQFGYRFSNDFAPFAVALVALAIARLGVRPLTMGLVALSVLINAWGVYWGVTLGW